MKARNVVPAEATTSIDMRLVKDMDYRQTVEGLLDHIRPLS